MGEVVERWYLGDDRNEVYQVDAWHADEAAEQWRFEVCVFEEYDGVEVYDEIADEWYEEVDESTRVTRWLPGVYRKEHGRRIVEWDNPAIPNSVTSFTQWLDVGGPLEYFDTAAEARTAGIERVRELARREIAVKVD